jgi:hypothetical protein
MLGSQAILEVQRSDPRLPDELGYYSAMGRQGAHDVTAAVKVQDRSAIVAAYRLDPLRGDSAYVHGFYTDVLW